MSPSTLDRVRFGLIGYGLFGRHHARAIERGMHAELAAIAVQSPDSQDRARQDHPQALVVGDYIELLAKPDIDAIDIVVPNHLHHRLAKAALEAGKHVLLEKPMALTVSECDELIAVARRQDRTLAIGHELRLSSLWGAARQLVDSGVVGDVQYVLVELSRFPYRPGSQGWRYQAEQVGSWVLEEPIHFLDLARWYLAGAGEPSTIYARGNSRPVQASPSSERPEAATEIAAGRNGLYDNFSALVGWEGGEYAVVTQTLAAFGHHQTAKIVGTRGTIWAEWHAADARSEKSTYSLRHGLGDEIHECVLSRAAGELIELDEEIEVVARAILEGSAPHCTGEDGRWSVLLCRAAEESIRLGQPVQLGSVEKGRGERGED